MRQPHISLAAEKIGTIFGLPVTNSILMTWIVMAALMLFAYLSTRKMSLVPSNLQSVAEFIIDGIYSLFKSVVGERHIERFFPILATIFMFVIAANWAGLLPGVGSIGFHEAQDSETVTESLPTENGIVRKAYGLVPKGSTYEVTDETQAVEEVPSDDANNKSESANNQAKFVPLLRGATADLNTTLAIAIIAVVSVQYYGFQTLGAAYFKKYFNFSNPIMFGVGLLEIVSEFSRIISFAFRLFGNIFAGEVLLTVIAFLMPLIAPLPFLGLELFVGFIQALVFSMLTAVFLNMATMSHAEH